MMDKINSIYVLIVISFVVFVIYTNSGLVLAQNQSSSPPKAASDIKITPQNQTNQTSQNPSSQTQTIPTQPGSIGQTGPSQSHSGQSQSQSGPTGSIGQSLTGPGFTTQNTNSGLVLAQNQSSSSPKAASDIKITPQN